LESNASSITLMMRAILLLDSPVLSWLGDRALQHLVRYAELDVDCSRYLRLDGDLAVFPGQGNGFSRAAEVSSSEDSCSECLEPAFAEADT
jgi:hypothetical protein